MSTPVSIAGVESGDRNILFFTKANGRLASLTAQKYGPEDLESPEYARGEVQSAGNPVSAAIPHIGAAAFTADGKKQVRIYYIGMNHQLEKLQLMELCYVHGEWVPGALDSKKFIVSEETRISAVVSETQNCLNVFYVDEDEALNVAWVDLGQEAWSNRIVYEDTL